MRAGFAMKETKEPNGGGLVISNGRIRLRGGDESCFQLEGRERFLNAVIVDARLVGVTTPVRD